MLGLNFSLCVKLLGYLLLAAVAVELCPVPVLAQNDVLSCVSSRVKDRTNQLACIAAAAGQSFRDCPDCPEMVVVPAGEFMMGSTRSERGRSKAEGPRQKVTFAKPIAVGKYEATFAEWDACVRDGGCSDSPHDKGWGRGARPVINVSWNQVTKQFLPWLSRKSGRNYRLLSEAEWEYAARAGTRTAYWWGGSSAVGKANCRGCTNRWGGKRSAPVGSFPANPFGIYDINGNVFELVADCWNKNHGGAIKDGVRRADGNCNRRVIRGGSWFTPAKWLRSATRSSDPINYRNSNVGFRVAVSLDKRMRVVSKPHQAGHPKPYLLARTSSFSGECNSGLAWHGKADQEGNAFARLAPCNNSDASDRIAFHCTTDQAEVLGRVEYLVSPDSPFTIQTDITITVDGKSYPFKATRSHGIGHKTLDFYIPLRHRLIALLSNGVAGTLGVGGQQRTLHLRGSRQAIAILKSGCLKSKTSQVAPRYSQEVPSEYKGIAKQVYSNPKSYTGPCFHGHMWHGRPGLAVVTNCERDFHDGKMKRIWISMSLRCRAGTQRVQGMIDYIAPNGSSLEFRPLRPIAPVRPVFKVGGYSVAVTATVKSPKESYKQHVMLNFKLLRDHALLDWLRIGRTLKVEIGQQVSTVDLRGAKKAIAHLLDGCSRQQIVSEPGAVFKPIKKKKNAPWVCHVGPKPQSMSAVSVRFSKRDDEFRIDEPIHLEWAVKHKHATGWYNPSCRNPVYLVLSTSKRTRFKGQGFLALPPGAEGPYRIRHRIEQTRIFIPLHLEPKRMAGALEVLAYQTGAVPFEWSMVEVPSSVPTAKQRNDLLIGQEAVQRGGVVGEWAKVRVGRPHIVIRDHFSIEQPKSVIISNSREFRLEVFEDYYRVVEDKSGELVLERAGKMPNFSPSSRFLAAFTEHSNLEAIDLYSGKIIYQGAASFAGWGANDAVFAPGALLMHDANARRGMSVLQTLVDNSERRLYAIPKGPLYKAHSWKSALSVDFESASVVIRGQQFRTYGAIGGGHAWASLIHAEHSSRGEIEKLRSDKLRCSMVNDDSACGGLAEEIVVAGLQRLAISAFADPNRLLLAKEPDFFSWRINGVQFAYSHLCNEWCDSIFSELRPDNDLIKELLVEHKSRQPANMPTAKTSNKALDRLAAVRSSVGSAATQLSLGRRTQRRSKVSVLKQLAMLGLDLSQERIAAVPIIEAPEMWKEEGKRFASDIVRKFGGPSRHLLPFDESVKVYGFGCGGSYDVSNAPPESINWLALNPINWRMVKKTANWRSGKGEFWIFWEACTNGAQLHLALWLLSNSADSKPQIVDISFLLRFQTGPNGPGATDEKKVEYNRGGYSNSMGYGSWPNTVDIVRVAHDRYLLTAGQWPGGKWSLIYDIVKQKMVRFERDVGSKSNIVELAITHDGTKFVRVMSNGELVIVDILTDEVVLRGVETDDELIVYEKNGYYLASPEGGQFLYLKFPGIPGYSSVTQFASTLNRPNAIKALLSGKLSLPKPNLTAPPELRIAATVSGYGKTRRANLDYQTSSEVGLRELVVFMDGRPVERVALTGKFKRGNVLLDLPAEARWVSTVAIDQSGYRSITRSQALPGAAAPDQSRLFVLTVGTDIYDDPSISQLGAAKRDAANFAKLASTQKGILYSEVDVTSLYDRADLKSALLESIHEVVDKASANDTIMLFAAGHGSRGKDDAFYLVSRTTELSDLEATAVSWSDIAAALDGVKARVVVFLDACRSGSAGQSGTNDDAVAALLQQSVPITVIAASKGYQNSEETALGGYFTNEIIRAIAVERDKTDTNGNGVIELAELYGAIKVRVVRATESNEIPGKQTPWIARNEMVGEIPLF